jgi:5-methyltetrahydrofolate--homocysteine methyltransferase
MPVLEGEKTVFKETPEFMASKVKDLIEAGAQIIGGCCGTTPEHIAAMARAIKAARQVDSQQSTVKYG